MLHIIHSLVGWQYHSVSLGLSLTFFSQRFIATFSPEYRIDLPLSLFLPFELIKPLWERIQKWRDKNTVEIVIILLLSNQQCSKGLLGMKNIPSSYVKMITIIFMKKKKKLIHFLYLTWIVYRFETHVYHVFQ